MHILNLTHLDSHCEVFLGKKKLVAISEHVFNANKENSALTAGSQESKEKAEMLTAVYSHGNCSEHLIEVSSSQLNFCLTLSQKQTSNPELRSLHNN